MHPQLTKHAARNAEHQQAMQIRNTLQIHLRSVLHRVNNKLSAGIGCDERQRLIGELQGFMAIRSALAPTIAPDRYAGFIHQAIADLNANTGFNDESHSLCLDTFETLSDGSSAEEQVIVLRRLVSGLSAKLPAATVDSLFAAELREAAADDLLHTR